MSRHGAVGALLVSVAWALAACATLTPVQEAELLQVRQFVDDTARVYGLGSVPVVVGTVPGAAAEWRSGTIFLGPAILGSPSRDALLAHELGHAVLGHRDLYMTSFVAPATLGEVSRRHVPLELDANAKAVEILVRVKSWSEPTAVQVVAEWLWRIHRGQQQGAPTALGHLSACEELRDLFARYPVHAKALLTRATEPGCPLP
jgi:hypothetical protein